MKVFLSWSRTRSKMVAAALNEWLPQVIQAVDPFFSSNVSKGAQWSAELEAALEGTRVGIVCLTRENLSQPWILYEAGALSQLPGSRVYTFVIDLRPSDLKNPLARFQATAANKSEVRQLVDEINFQVGAAGEKSVAPHVLNTLFEKLWPDLERRLQEAQQYKSKSVTPSRAQDPSTVLDQILDSVRALERRLDQIGGTRPVPATITEQIRVQQDPWLVIESLGEASRHLQLIRAAVVNEKFEEAALLAATLAFPRQNLALSESRYHLRSAIRHLDRAGAEKAIGKLAMQIAGLEQAAALELLDAQDRPVRGGVPEDAG